jgi:hypothetical protein
METNLLELITKSGEKICDYLGDVSIEDFINDVKTLVKNSSDKVPIEIAIKKLQELL